MGKLNGLAAWLGGKSAFSLNKSAQGVMSAGLVSMAAAGSYGSSCGAGDKDKDKGEEKPKPSACGAGDDDKGEKKPKPSACGSSCGAGDKK
jgi:hypothetical protein